MEKLRLGRTGIMASRTAFGALPVQRVPLDEAKTILRAAYDGGVNFFDTARGYTDSEEKIGHALADVRKDIFIATKAAPRDRAGVTKQLETSLEKLRTDHVDILQLHNPGELPDPDDPDSAYAALVEARDAGKVRFVGISCHRLDNALAAARSGLYDTVQYPLSAISAERDFELARVCREHDVGLIAMKALCGGLLADARVAFAGLRRFDNVLPIWGIQRMAELEEFLALEANPPALDPAMLAEIERTRAELGDDFCRGCGYCLPCPAEIPINMAARMAYVLRRCPTENFLSEHWRERMRRIEDCTDCGECRERCPYGLDPPALLRKMHEDYRTFVG